MSKKFAYCSKCGKPFKIQVHKLKDIDGKIQGFDCRRRMLCVVCFRHARKEEAELYDLHLDKEESSVTLRGNVDIGPQMEIIYPKSRESMLSVYLRQLRYTTKKKGGRKDDRENKLSE